MRTMRLGLVALVGLVLIVLLVGASGCAGDKRRESLDPSTMPENVRADYEVFARKCSKCHTLARPLNASITDDQQWVRYVNRMRRQPASGISPTDQEVILRFLRYYAADLRRIEAERHGAPPPAPPAPLGAPSGHDGGAP